MLTIEDILNTDREIVFICVGTDRSTGDSFGPLVGTKLQELGYTVYGTLENLVHAQNIHIYNEIANTKHSNALIVGIDSSLGNFDQVGTIMYHQKPLRPGAGLKKSLPEVGEVSITACVNVAGFMEYFVLQNTRLHSVMKLVDELVYNITQFLSQQQAASTKEICIEE